MKTRPAEWLQRISPSGQLLGVGLLFAVLAVTAGVAKHWGTSGLLAALALLLVSLAALAPVRFTRVTAAFVLSPLAPSAATLVLSSEPGALFVVVPYAYFFSLAGVPAYYFMRRMRWLRAWQVVAISAVLGALAGVFTFGGESAAIEWAKFSILGALTGLAFWLIAFWRSAHLNNTSTPSKGENAA